MVLVPVNGPGVGKLFLKQWYQSYWSSQPDLPWKNLCIDWAQGGVRTPQIPTILHQSSSVLWEYMLLRLLYNLLNFHITYTVALSILFNFIVYFCWQNICWSSFFAIAEATGFYLVLFSDLYICNFEWCSFRVHIILLSQLPKFVNKLLVLCDPTKDTASTFCQFPWAYLGALEHLASKLLPLTAKWN